MKQIYSYLVLLSLLVFVSCDDFLDIKPVGKVIPSTFQDYRDLMTNAYSSAPRERFLSTVRGDELQLLMDDYGSYVIYQSIFIWNDVNPDPRTAAFPWVGFYDTILSVNQIIQDAEKASEGTREGIDQVRGEAYLMRAYMHFALAGLYSDVYSTENLDKKSFPLSVVIDIWQDYKRNTIGEVYQQIFSDIEEGIKLLNVDEQSKGQNYRFSKVSAYGFAARVYAYSNNWQKAREYALKAYELNHKLVDLNDADAKLPVNYASDENILAMEYVFNSDLKSYFQASDKILAMFDKENDLRFAKYFKANDDGSYSFLIGSEIENKCSMRTAELYLLLAASEGQTGDLNKAKEYLKQLIVTRLKPDYYTTEAAAIDAMDKDAFLQRVADERFRELVCQGFRWYDLKYWGQPKIEKTFNGKSYVLENGDSRYTLPFPKEAVEANPNLVNN